MAKMNGQYKEIDLEGGIKFGTDCNMNAAFRAHVADGFNGRPFRGRSQNSTPYFMYEYGQKLRRRMDAGELVVCNDMFLRLNRADWTDVEESMRPRPIVTLRIQITDRSKALFLDYAKDADNWSGTPLVGGNLGGSAEDRGNLTQLKQAGLIMTNQDGRDTWIYFTSLGRKYAAEHGVKILAGAIEEEGAA